ncbi:MAG: hypothetical protein AAFV43_12515 [Planctomycetota bacterium]
MNFLRLSVALLIGSAAGVANAQLRVVTYNTLGKPAGPTGSVNQTDLSEVRTIFSAIAATDRNGIAKRPDIIALQEQTTFALIGDDFLLDSTALRIAEELNDLYGVTSYEVERNRIGGVLQAYVYDSATVAVSGSSLSIFSDGPRPAMRTRFQPVGYSSDDASVYLYNSHMKAGDSGSDQADRLSEAQQIRFDADLLGSDANVIYLGDFNIKTSSQAAYTELRSAGNAQAVDPVGLSSWPNSLEARPYLSQSTRTGSIGDGGAGGGVDDRFDMQLVTDDLLDGEGLSYLGPTAVGLGALEHSYQAFGNDGTSFNAAITSPPTGRSQPASVLSALFNFSDHLPVIADYQVPAIAELDAFMVPSTLELGEDFDLDVTLRNAADVVHENGADELDYILAATGAGVGGGAGTIAALSAGDLFSISLDTSSVGMKMGEIIVLSTSEGAEVVSASVPFAYEVLDVATQPGDFTGDGLVDNDDLNLLLNTWGDPAAPLPTGWNGSPPIGASIDNDELNDLLSNWGVGFAVPEPTSWILLAGCGLPWYTGRRRG